MENNLNPAQSRLLSACIDLQDAEHINDPVEQMKQTMIATNQMRAAEYELIRMREAARRGEVQS